MRQSALLRSISGAQELYNNTIQSSQVNFYVNSHRIIINTN